MTVLSQRQHSKERATTYLNSGYTMGDLLLKTDPIPNASEATMLTGHHHDIYMNALECWVYLGKPEGHLEET
jgi:hypothetical protein